MTPAELAADGWTLLDVEDVPVALSPNWEKAIAFDPNARTFPPASAAHNGMPVSEAEFSALVRACAAKP